MIDLIIKRGETKQKKLCPFVCTKWLDQSWRRVEWPFWNEINLGEPKWKISNLRDHDVNNTTLRDKIVIYSFIFKK